MMRRGMLIGLVTATLLLTAGCPPSGRESAPSPSPAVSACGAEEPLEPGRHEMSMTFGASERSFLLYVPDGYAADEPMPVIHTFHGLGGEPENHVEQTGHAWLVENEGVAVVAPRGSVRPGGHQTHWDIDTDPAEAASDLAFGERLIRHVPTLLCTDADRTFVTGMSNGSLFAFELACRTGAPIAAFAGVGALRGPDRCAHDVEAPYLYVHGIDDNVAPYAGGPTIIGELGPVEQNLDRWAARAGCAASRDQRSTTGLHRVWDDCDDGLRAESYAVEGLGHRWPLAPAFGDTINATVVIWEFFDQAARGSAA